MKILILALLMSITTACNNNTNTPSKIKTLGGFPYKEAKGTDSKIAAKINKDILVTHQQIESNAIPLKELVKMEDDYYRAFVYRSVREKLEKDQAESAEISFFREEPEISFIKKLKQLQFKTNDKITVKYAELKEDKDIIASVNGREVRISELNTNNIRFFNLKNRQYDEKLRALKGIATKMLLFSVAKENKQNIQDYVQTNIIKGEIKIDDQALAQYIEDNNLGSSIDTDELREQIRQVAAQKKRTAIVDKYIIDKLLKSPIEVYIKRPNNRIKINDEWAPVLGSKTAKNELFIFNNFNCDSCVNLVNNFNKIDSSLLNDFAVKFIYSFPDHDRDSTLFAEASMCGHLQEKFWPFIKQFSAEKKPISESQINITAKASGLNMEEFKACFLQRKTQKIVKYHTDYSKYLGLISVPSIVINGSVHTGPINSENLSQLLKNASPNSSSSGFLASLWSKIKTWMSSLF